MAHVVSILLRPSARTPVQRVERVEAIASVGLSGDHANGGRRQVTLLDSDAWNAACEEIGIAVDPSHRRANLVLAGFDLSATIGQTVVIGECEVEVVGETRPCELLDDEAPGLCAALKSDRRAGVYGRVTRGGTIAIGDTVALTG